MVARQADINEFVKLEQQLPKTKLPTGDLNGDKNKVDQCLNY